MIVSGMARGIDTAAHKGAMFALNRSGSTVAVLGTGIDIAYPAENQKLCEQIAGQGAVISEFRSEPNRRQATFPAVTALFPLSPTAHWSSKLRCIPVR